MTSWDTGRIKRQGEEKVCSPEFSLFCFLPFFQLHLSSSLKTISHRHREVDEAVQTHPTQGSELHRRTGHRYQDAGSLLALRMGDLILC